MKLDSEDQRQLILDLCQQVPINGNIAQVNQAAAWINGLMDAVKKAEIEKAE